MVLTEIFDRDITKKNNGLYIEKAKSTGGMVIVSVPWCIHCKRTLPILEGISHKLGSAYKFFFINGDKTEILKVQGFPTIFYIERDGKVSGKYTSGRDEFSILQGICDKSLVCKK